MLFGFGPEALDDADVQRDYVSAGNGARTILSCYIGNSCNSSLQHLVPRVRDHPLPLPWARNPGRRASS